MNIPNSEELEKLKKQYPPGTRVRLEYMGDMQAPPPGTEGTVKCVDSAGTVHITWDNGSSLGAVPGGVDRIETVPEKNKKVFHLKVYASAIVGSEETFDVEASSLEEAEHILTGRLDDGEVGDITWKYEGLDTYDEAYTFIQVDMPEEG